MANPLEHQLSYPFGDQLPATGFTVACFPLKLVGGSAAPARVVAIVD